MRPGVASSPSPIAMSSSSSWYDGGVPTGTSTWGFSFGLMPGTLSACAKATWGSPRGGDGGEEPAPAPRRLAFAQIRMPSRSGRLGDHMLDRRDHGVGRLAEDLGVVEG